MLGQLASGGMGTVWLAHVEGHPDWLVAVKRMHAHLARDGEFLSMFLDEIWMTGALEHPNVVALVGWGVDKRGPYFVAEMVEGSSLAALHRAGRAEGEPMPEELVAYVGSRIARGLHAAHTLVGDDGERLNIVHRDLTPSNVLVGFDGAVKITDFGVAKASQKITKTEVGILKGKVHYMAPEYVRGDPLDARSDLYSLGVLMYELCAGDRPLAGVPEIALLKKIASEPAPPLTSPGVDPALAGLIDTLRSMKPEDRGASSEEVAERLEGWLAGRAATLEACRERLAAYAAKHGARERDRIHEARRRGAAEPAEVFVTEATAARRRAPEPARPQPSARTGDAATAPRASIPDAPPAPASAPSGLDLTPTGTRVPEDLVAAVAAASQPTPAGTRVVPAAREPSPSGSGPLRPPEPDTHGGLSGGQRRLVPPRFPRWAIASAGVFVVVATALALVARGVRSGLEDASAGLGPAARAIETLASGAGVRGVAATAEAAVEPAEPLAAEPAPLDRAVDETADGARAPVPIDLDAEDARPPAPRAKGALAPPPPPAPAKSASCKPTDYDYPHCRGKQRR
jgi:hypothetical protein